jgi:hypothetical protein
MLCFSIPVPDLPTKGPVTYKPTADNFDPLRMIAITVPKFSDEKGKIRYVFYTHRYRYFLSIG